MKHFRLWIMIAGFLFSSFVSVTHATVPMRDHSEWSIGDARFHPFMAAPGDHVNPLAEILSICQYLDQWQVKDETDPEFGGMIEDEFRTGPDRIVESDNTQESVYVWSRYYQLTGDNTFYTNVQNAWTYLESFPAWQEGSDFYGIWNCGWGLRCSMQFALAYQDSTKDEYARQCALYISEHALELPFETSRPAPGIRNALSVAWAAWNLYAYADTAGDQAMRSKAVELATAVQEWIEADPEHIAAATWALSGGVAAACVLDVLFPDDPEDARSWSDQYLVNLVTYYDPDTSKPGDWISAWDSWQALAQNALWRTTGASMHRRTALEQSDYIRSLDRDDDGGIPANPNDPDTEDQTWVSTYIVLTGFADMEEPPRLSFVMNDREMKTGDTMETGLQIYGPGLDKDVEIFILLEIAGIFYSYPSFTQNYSSIPLSIPLDFDLAEYVGLTGSVPLIQISPWPAGIPEFQCTWWGALLQQNTMELLGEIISLEWWSVPE